jgi:flavodoxin
MDMKALVVYYSRTGNTKKVGQEIAKQLKSDIEQIEDVKSRLGPIGWLKSGREAIKNKLVEIKLTKKDPSKYDLAVIGTPVWAGTVSSPVRTYLSKHKFKKIALFCTCSGQSGKAFDAMERITGKKAIATLVIDEKEIKNGSYSKKVKEFVAKLK